MSKPNSAPFVSCYLKRGNWYRPVIHANNPDAVVKAISEILSDLDREVFISTNMDGCSRILNAHIITVGTDHSTLVAPSDIVRVALLSEASRVILVHNHPGEDVSSGKADINMTKPLNLCCALMDIQLADSIITGGDKIYSLWEQRPEVFDFGFEDIEWWFRGCNRS